jgi:hypothetical protein
MAKSGSVWGQIAWGRPLFIGGFNLLMVNTARVKLDGQ